MLLVPKVGHLSLAGVANTPPCLADACLRSVVSQRPLPTRSSPTYAKEKHSLSRVLLVPKVGLEPTRCRQQWILSPSRLPFHHFGLLIYYSISGKALQEIFSIARDFSYLGLFSEQTTASGAYDAVCERKSRERPPRRARRKIPLEKCRRRLKKRPPPEWEGGAIFFLCGFTPIFLRFFLKKIK